MALDLGSWPRCREIDAGCPIDEDRGVSEVRKGQPCTENRMVEMCETGEVRERNVTW